MLTAEERATILATKCPWPRCESVTGEGCWFYGPKKVRLTITTAEGGFHDVRVQKALGRPGRVVQRDPATGATRVVGGAPEHADGDPVPLGVLVSAGLSGPHSAPADDGDPDRPW
jgi:hypothetical protein